MACGVLMLQLTEVGGRHVLCNHTTIAGGLLVTVNKYTTDQPHVILLVFIFLLSISRCRSNITETIILSKDCEHSVVQLTRQVKLRRTPFRSRQSLRASIIYKGPAQFVTQQSVEPSLGASDQVTSTASTHETEAIECGSTVNGALAHTGDDKGQGKTFAEHQHTFISNHHIWKFTIKLKQWKILTLYRSNNIKVVQYRKMQGPLQFHT